MTGIPETMEMNDMSNREGAERQNVGNNIENRMPDRDIENDGPLLQLAASDNQELDITRFKMRQIATMVFGEPGTTQMRLIMCRCLDWNGCPF